MLLRLCAVAAACRDATDPAAEVASTFSGEWAGKPWAGRAEALLVRGGAAGDTLYVFGVWPADGVMVQQVVRVRVAPFVGAGSYALAAGAAEVTDLVGGDAVSASYVGPGRSAAALEVRAYGGVGAEVAGVARFEAQPARTLAPYGAVARFEGTFRATVRTPPSPSR
jgi:hypothetical protein